ncbi:MAG: hypothetical protein QOH41_1604 [Blastocatellia bacterium]|jgi:hypothetical protein|nr:hypothetical protein [Blastocatellia bacterium]
MSSDLSLGDRGQGNFSATALRALDFAAHRSLPTDFLCSDVFNMFISSASAA